MKFTLKTPEIRSLSTIAATLLAIPLGWKGLTGFYCWLSPFVMLNSVFVLKSFVFLNLAGVIVFLITIFKKRFFCRYLCPVGWGCDHISRLSREKASSHKKVPFLGKWLALLSIALSVTGLPLLIVLDPMSVFNGFFSAFSTDIRLTTIISLAGLPILFLISFFFPGIWCGKLCPLGGLQLLVTDIKEWIISLLRKKEEPKYNYSTGRRFFVVSGAGLAAGLIIPKILKSKGKEYFRPPASLPASQFNTLCIRCGNCIKACPAKFITHHCDPNDILSWMSPEVNFTTGYCLEECNICSRVCPTGSITFFSPEDRKQIVMGTAEINISHCLLTKNRECARCNELCKYEAISIEPGEGLSGMVPVVNHDKCVGCGACSLICPTSTIKMIPPPLQA